MNSKSLVHFTFKMHVIRKILNLCANFQIRDFCILCPKLQDSGKSWWNALYICVTDTFVEIISCSELELMCGRKHMHPCSLHRASMETKTRTDQKPQIEYIQFVQFKDVCQHANDHSIYIIQLCTILYNCTTVLYAVDNGLHGQNVSSVASVVSDSATYLLTISSSNIGSVWPSPLYWVIPSWASFASLEAILQSSVHSRKQLPLWSAHLNLRVDIILHSAQNYPSYTCNAVEVLPAAFMFLVVTLSRDR